MPTSLRGQFETVQGGSVVETVACLIGGIVMES